MTDRASQFEAESQEFINELLTRADSEGAFCIVLTGSLARGAKPALWTDVDLLAIESNTPKFPPSVHLIEMKRTEFVHRMESGDDFVQWAARYGRPLYGARRWKKLVADLLPNAPWPDYRKKLQQAERRLRIGRQLLDVGDDASTQKELVYAASHIGRAALLKQQVFPLSRPELPFQLSRIGEHQLGSIIERLATSLLSSTDNLEEIVSFLTQKREILVEEASRAS